MMEFLKRLDWIAWTDSRQQSKVRHALKDIVVIVLFATFADADDWVEIAMFAKIHEAYLRKYLRLENGVPSHDTIQRAMSMLSPEVFRQIQADFQETLNGEEGEKLKKIIAIDGKTMRGNQQNGGKPSHIVSAWSDGDGFCLGQTAVDEKSNEITAIPELLSRLNIRKQVVTIDAMGTQTKIAEKIREKKADYVLALKKNHKGPYYEAEEYFQDADFQKKIQQAGGYKRTEEKAHGRQEIREYYQTGDIGWMESRSEWADLKSIGMEKKTPERKDGSVSIEYRYFISSLKEDIALFSRAVRQHWSVEVMHWHLDITFREDANHTIDKNSAQNLNIIRKFCLSVLKLVEILHPRLSMKKKRFAIAHDTEKYLESVLNF
jgi:predicted transposase YbfD/YdcC